MATIAATSYATQSLQSMLSRSRVEQARREADSAENKAQSLRQQANAAEQEAQGRKANVRALKARESSSESTYSKAVQGDSGPVASTTQKFLEEMYRAASPKFAASGNPLKNDANAPPVLNTQGQSTGRILNLSA
jgi:septal ring factor EnvC (AmiA/AmiB activator)